MKKMGREMKMKDTPEFPQKCFSLLTAFSFG